MNRQAFSFSKKHKQWTTSREKSPGNLGTSRGLFASTQLRAERSDSPGQQMHGRPRVALRSPYNQAKEERCFVPTALSAASVLLI